MLSVISHGPGSFLDKTQAAIDPDADLAPQRGFNRNSLHF
jgi:hypothetical protein